MLLRIQKFMSEHAYKLCNQGIADFRCKKKLTCFEIAYDLINSKTKDKLFRIRTHATFYERLHSKQVLRKERQLAFFSKL